MKLKSCIYQFKSIYMLFFFMLIIFCLSDEASASSLTADEVRLGSTAVKDYTNHYAKIPRYVKVNGKTSSTASFLKTTTQAVVQINQNNTTPVIIKTVNPPTGPSGSAYGIINKTEYIYIAAKVNSYINTYSRAPSFAVSSIGNIRYESLVYMYAKIMSCYRYKKELPREVGVVRVSKISTQGVTVQDTIIPTVKANLYSGAYNTRQTVSLTASDDIDSSPDIYYTTNGVTPTAKSTKYTSPIHITTTTTLKFIAVDDAGNKSGVKSISYIIDTTVPKVTASLDSGLYNSTQSVTLTAMDDYDSNPQIYYTINGGTPTIYSSLYTSPINITNSTTLKFIAVDDAGNLANVQTVYFIFSHVGNINTGRGYSSIQSALNDLSTLSGHTILVSDGTYLENIMLNKKLTLKNASPTGVVTVQAADPSYPVFTVNSSGSGSIICGFTITNGDYGFLLDSTSNCTIIGNTINGNDVGIYIQNSENNEIKANKIINNGMAIYLSNSIYNTLLDNSVSVVIEGPGIRFDNSSNNTFAENDIEETLYISNHSINNIITGNNISSVYINYYSTGNNLTRNNIACIFISNSNNTAIYENNIKTLYIYNSNAEIHFNRIVGGIYGLKNDGGTINATNNWWGTNNISYINSINQTTSNCNIWNKNGTVNYNPWLVLNINTSTTNSGGNTNVNADLTGNNHGEDTSSDGHIPNGLPVNFTTNFGSIITPTYTCKGKATTILNLGSADSVDVNISVEMDGTNIYKEFAVSLGVAILNITSSALDPSTLCHEFLSYQNVTERKVFDWYKLAVLMAGPSQMDDTDGINALENYLNNAGYGDIYLVDMGGLPEAEVKYLIHQHLYSDWWGDEALNMFVYYWDLPESYYQHIEMNYQSWDVVNDLYNYMYDDLGNCTVKSPPRNDINNSIWLTKIWNDRQIPSISFPATLPYVPSSWVTTSTTTVPVYQDTYSPLSITYEIPLDDPVKWVSIVWEDTQKTKGLFTGKLDLIVNGKVVVNKEYFNDAYLKCRSLPKEVFNAIIYVNRLLRPDQEDIIIQSQNKSIWDILGDYLTVDEVQFVKDYRTLFMDSLNLTLTYPGEDGKMINLMSSDGTENLTLNFGGNPIQRTSTIIYGNGVYIHNELNPDTNTEELVGEPAGYEGVRSFAIVTSKVTINILQYWMEQKDRKDSNGNLLYPEGPKKAAYGTFLAALLMIYSHDIVADAATSKFNVNWSRTIPIIVSAEDEAYNYYLTLECDHSMGMTVTGDLNNQKAFRYACSSAINPIEYWVMKSLFPNMNTNSTVTMGLGQLLMDGEPLEIYECNGYTVIKAPGDDTRILLIDPETGIVRDILMSNISGWINGAYCYYNQQTEMANDLAKQVLTNPTSWLGMVGSISLSVSSVLTEVGVSELASILLGSNPAGWIVGLAMVCAAIDGYLITEYPDVMIPNDLKALPVVGPLLSINSLQAVLRGQSDPLSPENMMHNCERGAYLLLMLNEDDEFDNRITELETLVTTGNYDPNDYVMNNMYEEYKEGQTKLDGLAGDDGDPDKWKKLLGEAMNKAITEKKWWKVATVTAAGALWASKDFLYQLVNHKNP